MSLTHIFVTPSFFEGFLIQKMGRKRKVAPRVKTRPCLSQNIFVVDNDEFFCTKNMEKVSYHLIKTKGREYWR